MFPAEGTVICTVGFGSFSRVQLRKSFGGRECSCFTPATYIPAAAFRHPGLLINFVHHYWPSLLKIDGFLQEFITPIVKVAKGE